MSHVVRSAMFAGVVIVVSPFVYLGIGSVLSGPASAGISKPFYQFLLGDFSYHLYQQEEDIFIAIERRRVEGKSVQSKPVEAKTNRRLAAEVFTLNKPNRLVVDLKQGSSLPLKQLALSHPLLSAVRIAGHADKTRLVVDLSEHTLVKRVSEPKELGAAVLVHFTLSVNRPRINEELFDVVLNGEITTTTLSDKTPEDKIVPAEKEDSTPQAQHEVKLTQIYPPLLVRTKEGIITNKLNKSIDTTQNEEEEPSSDIDAISEIDEEPLGAAEVTAFSFTKKRAKSLAALLIEAEGLSNYSLEKPGPSQYRLVLPNASLRDSKLLAELENFAEGEGFREIKTQQQADKLTLHIEVEKFVRLEPFLARGRLWLKGRYVF